MEYKVKKGDLKELLVRMDIIPTSIALAQAAKESGWGTSRFALEGNAIFGQWTWSGQGIAPLDRESNKNHKILKFPIFGENYRLKGEDIRKGQKILSKGSKINHQNINLIAASGIRKVKVFKKIKIGFFTSGNELRKPTTNLKNSEINNSNFFALNSLLDQKFISKKYFGNLKDNLKIVKNNLLRASKKNNVIIYRLYKKKSSRKTNRAFSSKILR